MSRDRKTSEMGGRVEGAALLLVACSLAGCSSNHSQSDADADETIFDDDADITTHDAESDVEEPQRPDADARSCQGMADDCASEFGSLFTRANGRADGTLLAVVGPTDTQCPMSNNDHVVLQISILGHVQRLVVSVDEVAVYRTRAPLFGPDFSEGWHTDIDLDYARDLHTHSDDFWQMRMEDVVSFICSEVEIGAPISVYAYTDGDYPSSAHQIHRNDRYPDGAIAANPTSESPTYLLFRYRDQRF